jgi:flagellar assembly protein FliH
MKPSSPDLPQQRTAPDPTVAQAPAAAAVGAGPGVVRPARMDRPLGRRLLAPGYADAALETMVAAAATKAQEAARAHGYASGWAQGRQAAAEQASAEQATRQARLEQDRRDVAARGQALLAGLADAVRREQQAGVPDWHDVADALTDGALALAAAALGRELATVDEPLLDAVRVAVRALGDPDRVAVHLHPADAETLALADLPAGLRLVPDPQVPQGTVQAQTPVQRLLLNLPAALAAAEAVLRS